MPDATPSCDVILIAESAPAAKDLMIRLVVNLLSERAG